MPQSTLRRKIFWEISKEIPENLELFCMPDDSQKSRSVPVSVSVSPRLHSYLGWLARNTILGTKETDVAGFLLTRELRRMLKTKEHKKLVPPDDETTSPARQEGAISGVQEGGEGA
jgi:hypothetical protein